MTNTHVARTRPATIGFHFCLFVFFSRRFRFYLIFFYFLHFFSFWLIRWSFPGRFTEFFFCFFFLIGNELGNGKLGNNKDQTKKNSVKEPLPGRSSSDSAPFPLPFQRNGRPSNYRVFFFYRVLPSFLFQKNGFCLFVVVVVERVFT